MARGNATFDQQEGFLQDFTSDVVAKDFDDDIECKELDDGIEEKGVLARAARMGAMNVSKPSIGKASAKLFNKNRQMMLAKKPPINYAGQQRIPLATDRLSSLGVKGVDERQIEEKGLGDKVKRFFEGDQEKLALALHHEEQRRQGKAGFWPKKYSESERKRAIKKYVKDKGMNEIETKEFGVTGDDLNKAFE